MAHKIIIKKQFSNDLYKVLTYLEQEWGRSVADGFLAKIEDIFLVLENHPFTGAPSMKLKKARSIFITEHNRLFYKIEGRKIYLLRLLDTRQKNY